jgi:hypothetical protein
VEKLLSISASVLAPTIRDFRSIPAASVFC